MKFKYLLIYLLITCAGFNVEAQIFPKLGTERAGISALTFLKLEVSPRAEAMSGAQISLNGDAYSCGWNPATMTELTDKTIALSDRVMPAGIMNSYASGIFPLKNQAALGVSLTSLNSGEIEKRTVFQPEGTGEYVYASNLAFGLSYAKVLSDYFSIGVSAKYVREQLAEFYANTVAIDLGFLYKTDFKDLRFAVLLQNFGPNFSLNGTLPPTTFIPSGTETIDPYPVSGQFKMGISMVPYKTELAKLTTIIQVNHPNDNAENIALGLEYCYNKIFFLRAGYKINVKDQSIPSFGIGIIGRIGKYPLHIDYAVSSGNTFTLAHTLGVSLYFNRQNRDEKK
jgi:hypothetical protein